MDNSEQEQIKRCVRCGAIRTDDVDSNICGSCADDLRMEQDAHRQGEMGVDDGG